MFDGEPEFGDPLHLVDEHEAWGVQERNRVLLGRRSGSGVVEIPFHDLGVVGGAMLGQGALPGLPGSVDDYYPRVAQSLLDQFRSPPGQVIHSLAHEPMPSAVVDLPNQFLWICRYGGCGSAEVHVVDLPVQRPLDERLGPGVAVVAACECASGGGPHPPPDASDQTRDPNRSRTALASWVAVPSAARCAMASGMGRPWWAMAWAYNRPAR